MPYPGLLNLQVHSLSCQVHATVIGAVLGARPAGIHTAMSQALPQQGWVIGVHRLWIQELLLLPLLWDNHNQGEGRRFPNPLPLPSILLPASASMPPSATSVTCQ